MTSVFHRERWHRNYCFFLWPRVFFLSKNNQTQIIQTEWTRRQDSNSPCVCRLCVQWIISKNLSDSQIWLHSPSRSAKSEIRTLPSDLSTLVWCKCAIRAQFGDRKITIVFSVFFFFFNISSVFVATVVILMLLSTAYDIYYTLADCTYANSTYFNLCLSAEFVVFNWEKWCFVSFANC